MQDYAVCGLRLRATRPLPGLTAAAGPGAWDVMIELDGPSIGRGDPDLADPPLYTSADRDGAGRPLVTVWRRAGGTCFLLRYADGTEFDVDRAGTHVRARWPAPSTLDDVATYLLGPVLAFAMRRRGVTCLHASAVALGERAIALVGPAGAGKSTLAAALARRGHAGLSDDVLALGRAGGDVIVHPGPTRIRLWPESVTALYGWPDALPRLTPTWDKRFLDLAEGDGPGLRPRPLAAIYLLTDGEPVPRMERVSFAEGLMALVANTSVNYLLDERTRAQEFAMLAEVVSAVPIQRLVRGEDPARLDALCRLVVADVESRDPRGARV